MLTNINPKIWGNSYWDTAHLITFSYPVSPSDEDRQTIRDFFMIFKKVLPCEKCRNNFNEHLKTYPLNDSVLESRYNLIVWLINIHNEVNKMLGKKVMSIDKVITKYSNKENISYLKNAQMWTIILLIILIIILIIYTHNL